MNNPYKGIPESIRVGCYDFRIIVGTHTAHEQDGTFGHMSSLEQSIHVRPGMTGKKLANTFIHECIHAIHWVYGLWRREDETPATEEQYTEFSSNGICALWQDNPEAMKWWNKAVTSKD